MEHGAHFQILFENVQRGNTAISWFCDIWKFASIIFFRFGSEPVLRGGKG